MDSSGRFAIAWQNGTSVIFVRLFDGGGAPVTNQIRGETLNYPGGGTSQQYPVVAMNATGNFVVAWTSALEENASTGDGVYFTRFDANGNRLGTQQHANVYMTDAQQRPAAALADDGTLTVAWQSNGQEQFGTSEAADYGVYLQRFDANNILLSADRVGSFTSADVRVSAYTPGNQQTPQLTMLSDGEVLLAWASAGEDGSGDGVYFRVYDEAGQPVGGVQREHDHQRQCADLTERHRRPGWDFPDCLGQ